MLSSQEARPGMSTTASATSTTVQGNKALVVRFLERVNKADLDGAAQLLGGEPYQSHFAGLPPVTGVESWRQMAAGFYQAFPDLNVSLEGTLIGEDEYIACRYTWSGTHAGPFMSMPATGRRVTVVGTNVFRLHGDRIVEQWETQDIAGLLQQLSATAG
jgi:steroid delta-isomerase-like uncharacterized protein